MAPKKETATGGGGGKGGKQGGGVRKTTAPRKGTGSGGAAASRRGNPPSKIETQARGIGRRTRAARGHRAGEGEEVSPLEIRDVDRVLKEGKGKGRTAEETEDSGAREALQSQRPADADDATEGEQQAQGSDVPAAGGERTSPTTPSGKRARGDAVDDADGASPKKTKKGEGRAGIGEGGSQQVDAPGTAEGACEKLSRLLNERTQSLHSAIEQGEFADDPLVEGPEEGQRLHSLAVWRAIAAVTEAITQQGNGTEFSLIDGVNFDFIRRGEQLGQNVVRPGNEAFIPRIERHTVPVRKGRRGNNADYVDHTSLFHLRREEPGYFSLQHYDTANQFDNHRRDVQTYGDSIRNSLLTAGWNPHRHPDIAAAQDAGNRGRQLYNWECSYYAVIFSWALALGLDISSFDGIRHDYGLFSRRLVSMLELALQGFLDSETIEAFLKCYRFVTPDAQIPEERRFARTVPFRAGASLETRTRLEHEIRQAAEAFETQIPATLGLLLQALGEPESNLQDADGFDYVQRYVDLQRLSEPRTPSRATNLPANPDSATRARHAAMEGGLTREDVGIDQAVAAGLQVDDAGRQGTSVGRDNRSVDEAKKGQHEPEMVTPGPGRRQVRSDAPYPSDRFTQPNTSGTGAAGLLPVPGNRTVEDGPAASGGNTRLESPLKCPPFSEDSIDTDLRTMAIEEPESGAPAGGLRALLDELPEPALVGPRGLLTQWHDTTWLLRWLLRWRLFLQRIREEEGDPPASAQSADIATFIRQQAEEERQFLVGEDLIPADRTFNDGDDSVNDIQRAQILYLNVHVEQPYIREAEAYIRAETGEPSFFEQTMSWIFNGGLHPLGLTEDEEEEVQRLQSAFRERHHYHGVPRNPRLDARLRRLGTAIRTLFPAQRDVVRAGIPEEQMREVDRMLRERDTTLVRNPQVFVENWVQALRGLIRAHANRNLTTDADRAAAREAFLQELRDAPRRQGWVPADDDDGSDDDDRPRPRGKRLPRPYADENPDDEDEDLYDDSQRGGRDSSGGAGGRSSGPSRSRSQGGSSRDLPSRGWNGETAMQELLNNLDVQDDPSSSSVPPEASDEQPPDSGIGYQDGSNAQDDEGDEEEKEDEVLGVPQEFLDLVEEVRREFGEPSGEDPLGERLEALWADLQEAGVSHERQLYILTGWVVAQEDRLQDEEPGSNRASPIYAGLSEAEQDRLTWIFEQLYREDATERLREQTRWLQDFSRAPQDRALRVEAPNRSDTMQDSRTRYVEEIFWHLAEQRGRRVLRDGLPAWFPPVEIAHNARMATRGVGGSAVVADGEAAWEGLQELSRRLEAAGLPPGVRARLNAFFDAQGSREAPRQELWQRQRLVRAFLRLHGDVREQYQNDQVALESNLIERMRSWQYQYLGSPRWVLSQEGLSDIRRPGGESASYVPSSPDQQSGAATHEAEDAQNGVTSHIYPPKQPQMSPDQQRSSSSGVEPTLQRYDEARLNAERRRAQEYANDWVIQRQAVPGTEEQLRDDARARANELWQNPEFQNMLLHDGAPGPVAPPPPRTERPAEPSATSDYKPASPLSYHSSEDGSRVPTASFARSRGPNAHLDSPVGPPFYERGYSQAQLEDMAARNRLRQAARDATPEHQPPGQQSGGRDNNVANATSSSLNDQRSTSYEGNQTRYDPERRSLSYDSPTPFHPGRGTSMESSRFNGGSDSSHQARQSPQSHSPAAEHELRGEFAEPAPRSSPSLNMNASRRGTESSLPYPPASFHLPDAGQAEEPDDRSLFDGDLEDADDTSAVEQQSPSTESPTPGLGLPPSTGPPTAFFMPIAPAEIVPPLPQFQIFPGALSPKGRKRSWEKYAENLTGEKSDDNERSKSPRTQTEPQRTEEGHLGDQEDQSPQRRSISSEIESSLVNVRGNLIDVFSGERIGTRAPSDDDTSEDSAPRQNSANTACQLQSRIAEQRRLCHPHHHHRRPYS